ncbi:unnamed protein product [Blepharisma stoltei]|uniref:Importin subunit alpha n=1 Tax=Blepharisma stoltei TaxID=1481888 RepID=A0AAU9JV02_9CILI|nr:unnamed protein product [Blepharisma stoltei]
MEPKFGFAQNLTRSSFSFGESNSQSSLFNPNNSSNTPSNEISSSSSHIKLARKHAEPIEKPSILEAIDKINSDDAMLQREGLKVLKKGVSREDSSPLIIYEIISSDICERILDLAQTKTDNKFLLEALWLFSNILSKSSREASYLVQLDVIPFLFSILCKNNNDFSEPVMMAFGNIAADNSEWRELVINDDNFSCIADLCNNADFSNESFINIYAWSVSNILRECSEQNPEKLIPFSPFLYRVVVEAQAKDTLTEATLGCSYLSELEENLEIFKKELFIEKIIRQLSSRKGLLLTASLKIIRNIVFEMDNSFEILSKYGFFEKIEGLLDHKSRNLRWEVCWTLLNLVAESTAAIDKLLENKIFEKLLTIIKTDSRDVQTQALEIIKISVTVCEENQIIKLAEIGIIKELISSLKCKKWRPIIFEALSAVIEKVPYIINDEENDIIIQSIDDSTGDSDAIEPATSLREVLQNNRNSS